MTGRNPSIVVIDDSPTSISLYERSIDGLGVELIAFESPSESLDYLKGHAPDLVFLDILLRERDGIGFLKHLRGIERLRATPIVVVTAKDYAQDRKIANELGVSEYLVKPLRSQEIREIIIRYTEASARPD